MKRFALLIPLLVLVVTILAPTPATFARISHDSGPAAIATRSATPTVVAEVPLVTPPPVVTVTAVAPPPVQATTVPAQTVNFPLPADAAVIPNPYSRTTTIFTTALSFSEVVDFYRAALAVNGAQERAYLTFIEEEEGWFSMVFDGWAAADGKAVVVQGVTLLDGSATISIRLERVD